AAELVHALSRGRRGVLRVPGEVVGVELQLLVVGAAHARDRGAILHGELDEVGGPRIEPRLELAQVGAHASSSGRIGRVRKMNPAVKISFATFALTLMPFP